MAQYWNFASGDYVTTGGSISNGTALTVSCWVRYTGGESAKAFVAQYTTPTNDRSWLLYNASTPGSRPTFVVSGNGTATVATSGSGSINTADGNWHHIAAVFNAGSVQIYTDGAADGSANATGVADLHDGGLFQVGAVNTDSTPAQLYDGDIRRVKVWDSALSSSDIAAEYAGGNVGSPVLFWNAAEGSGTTAIDSSGNGNNGTITAATIGEFHAGTPDTELTVSNRIVQRGDAITVSRGAGASSSNATEVEVAVFLDSDDSTVVPYRKVANSTDGSFSASITLPPGGPYYLSARSLSASRSVLEDLGDSATILVGDVFLHIGQSNAMGRGTNDQTYGGTPAVWAVREDGTILTSIDDPTSTNSSDVDGAGPLGTGSVRPLLAELITSHTEVPCVFYVNAKGGMAIAQWNRPSGQMWTSLTTQLTVMPPTSFRAVLWHQGESDAGASTANYGDTEADLFTAINGVLPGDVPPIISSLIGEYNSGANQDLINAGKIANWNSGASKHGPNVTWRNLEDDDLHFTTDADLASLAAMWWLAIYEHCFNGSSSRLELRHVGSDKSNSLELEFSQDLDADDTTYSSTVFSVDNDDGAAVSVVSASRTAGNKASVVCSGAIDGSSPTFSAGNLETMIGATPPKTDAKTLPTTVNGLAAQAIYMEPAITKPVRSDSLTFGEFDSRFARRLEYNDRTSTAYLSDKVRGQLSNRKARQREKL